MRPLVPSVGLPLVAALAVSSACARRPEAGQHACQQTAEEVRPAPPRTGPRLASSDLYWLKSIGDVQLSPDGRRKRS